MRHPIFGVLALSASVVLLNGCDSSELLEPSIMRPSELAAPPPPPPEAASATDAIAVNGGVGVSWDHPNQVEFRIERSMDGGVAWTLAGTTPDAAYNFISGSHSFYVSSQPEEQQICYRVVAFTAGGDAAPSNVDCTTLPAAPTDLIGSRVDSLIVDLAWSDNTALEDGYEVVGYIEWEMIDYCAPYECGIYYEVGGTRVIAVLPANSTTYRCTDCGSAEWLYVYARKDDGGSSGVAQLSPVP